MNRLPILMSKKSGAGEHRTPVRTKHYRAFYMRSRQSEFSSHREVGRPTRTVTLALISLLKAGDLRTSLSRLIRGAAESSRQRYPEGY